MRAGCFVVVVAVALLWGGGQGVYQGLKNREPKTLTCQDFYSQRPSAEWLHLTGCRVQLLDSTYRERFGVLQEVFAPVVPDGEQGSRPVQIIVASSDADTLALLKEMREIDKKNDKGALFAFLAKNAKRLLVARDVEGMVRTGIDRNDKTFRRLKELNKDLVAEYVVIDEGKKPSLVTSFLMLGGGVLAALLVIGMMARRGA